MSQITHSFMWKTRKENFLSSRKLPKCNFSTAHTHTHRRKQDRNNQQNHQTIGKFLRQKSNHQKKNRSYFISSASPPSHSPNNVRSPSTTFLFTHPYLLFGFLYQSHGFFFPCLYLRSASCRLRRARLRLCEWAPLNSYITLCLQNKYGEKKKRKIKKKNKQFAQNSSITPRSTHRQKRKWGARKKKLRWREEIYEMK